MLRLDGIIETGQCWASRTGKAVGTSRLSGWVLSRRVSPEPMAFLWRAQSGPKFWKRTNTSVSGMPGALTRSESQPVHSGSVLRPSRESLDQRSHLGPDRPRPAGHRPHSCDGRLPEIHALRFHPAFRHQDPGLRERAQHPHARAAGRGDRGADVRNAHSRASPITTISTGSARGTPSMRSTISSIWPSLRATMISSTSSSTRTRRRNWRAARPYPPS